MNTIPNELIEKAKGLLKKDIYRASVNQQFYSFFGEKTLDKDLYLSGPYPCYGNTSLKIKADSLIMVDKSIAVSNLKENKEYSRYCLNDSVFSHVFITKDIEEIIELKGTILDVRYSGHEVISGAISLRFLSEEKNKINTWNIMVKNGINKDIAFILMNFYNYENNILIPYLTGSGHSWLNYYQKIEDYKTLFKNIYKRNIVKKESFNISFRYTPTDVIFISNGMCGYASNHIEEKMLYKGDKILYKDSLGRVREKYSTINVEDFPKLEQWFLDFIGE